MNTHAARTLCAAVIEFALSDYKMHERAGRIQNGLLTSKRAMTRRDGTNHAQTDAASVLHFFKKGSLDRWIEVGALDIDPGMIRSKLGIN